MGPRDGADARAEAERLAAEGRRSEALERLWPLLDTTPEDAGLKVLAARLVGKLAGEIDPAHETRLLALLTAPEVDPMPVALAGWRLLEAAGRLPGPDAAGALAAEADPFILALLAETSLAYPPTERVMTALRRWLLLSGRGDDFPGLAEAFRRQAARNGGAWPFDAEERAVLATAGALAEAYQPPRPAPGDGEGFGAPVTRTVARFYEAWPYPAWERVMTAAGATLDDLVAGLGPDAPRLPERPRILVAGCGTGREAMLIAQRAPHARITAIDLSAASLAFAAERCRSAGNIDFRRHDLHEAAALGPFDMVSSSGVLHHLADPEAGWAALTAALRPGGTMSLMLYSRLARMRLAAARRRVADLLDRPMDDDLLRQVRGRLIAEPAHPVAYSLDFSTLGGVHDLLFHPQEQAFDVPRIRRAIDTLGLDFLGFHLPGSARRARYRQDFPHDPWFRDYEAWARVEWREPELFAGMYRFWCRKPL